MHLCHLFFSARHRVELEPRRLASPDPVDGQHERNRQLVLHRRARTDQGLQCLQGRLIIGGVERALLRALWNSVQCKNNISFTTLFCLTRF